MQFRHIEYIETKHMIKKYQFAKYSSGWYKSNAR